MEFNPDEKIQNLFYEYMYFPKRQDVWDYANGERMIHKEAGESISEDEISNYIDHNMEYIKWGFEKDIPYFKWLSLGIFYGQEENFKKIRQDFCAWLSKMQRYLQKCIVDTINKMKAMDVVPEKITLPQNWTQLLPQRFILDLKCDFGKPYVYSNDLLGRMILIDGIK